MIKNRLKVILAEKNISQNELAEKIGINRTTLSNLISGKQGCTLEVAFDISKYLKMLIEDIFYKEMENGIDFVIFEDFKQLMYTCNNMALFYGNQSDGEDDLLKMLMLMINGFYVKNSNIDLMKYLSCFTKEVCGVFPIVSEAIKRFLEEKNISIKK